MLDVVRAVRLRVDKLLARSEPRDDDAHHALDRCAQLALFRGDVRQISDSADHDAENETSEPRRDGGAVDQDGYNLEASVRIEADDDFGREHLLRYCARPSLALGRMSVLPGGRIAYRIKKLRNGRAKVRVMTPVELLARLAAIIPPPRHPLVRFHGAFASRSSWRRDVVPKLPQRPAHPEHPESHRHTRDEHAKSAATKPATKNRASSSPSAVLIPSTELLAPNVIAVKHWERLKSGALVATSPRVDWAKLLHRTFDADALECPKCAGRIRVLAVVDEHSTVVAILAR
jgi:hypothetical protein